MLVMRLPLDFEHCCADFASRFVAHVTPIDGTYYTGFEDGLNRFVLTCDGKAIAISFCPFCGAMLRKPPEVRP